MKIKYGAVLDIDRDGELTERFLEAFPSGEVAANEAACRKLPAFPWHELRDVLPIALRERYRVARNALIDERDAAREAAASAAPAVKEETSSRDGREGLENEYWGGYTASPAQAAVEAVNKKYKIEFAALFGKFAGKIP